MLFDLLVIVLWMCSIIMLVVDTSVFWLVLFIVLTIYLMIKFGVGILGDFDLFD